MVDDISLVIIDRGIDIVSTEMQRIRALGSRVLRVRKSCQIPMFIKDCSTIRGIQINMFAWQVI